MKEYIKISFWVIYQNDVKNWKKNVEDDSTILPNINNIRTVELSINIYLVIILVWEYRRWNINIYLLK